MATNPLFSFIGNTAQGLVNTVTKPGQGLSNILNYANTDINALGSYLKNTAKADINAFNPKTLGQDVTNMRNEGNLEKQKVQGKISSQDNQKLQDYKNKDLAPIIAGMGGESKSVVDKVVAPDAAKSLYGSEHTAAIQDALQRNGVQDYSQIADAAHGLYDKTIKPILTSTPKLINLDNVTGSIVSEMRKMKPGLEVGEATKAAGGVINDMYNLARGESGANPVPSHIDTPSIFNIKQDLNGTQAVKNFFNGHPISDLGDLATVAARNALGKVIQAAHPEIAQATKDYSLLSDAVPSLYKASEQAAKDAANKQNPLTSFLKGTVSSPTHLAATATTLGGLGLGAYAYQEAASQPKNYKFSSGDVTLPALSQITDSTGNPLTVNPSDFANQVKSLNEQENSIALNVKLGIPSAVAQQAQIENQKQSLEAKYDTVKPIYDQYVETSNQLQGLSQAQQLLKNANPQWFQAFGPLGAQFTAIRAATVPGYAQFEQQLNNLQKQYGIDVSVIKSAADPQAADQALNQTVKSYQAKLQNTIKNAGGVWPGDNSTNSQSATGGQIIQNQANQINTGSSTLNSILSPTPAQPDAQPTPDSFQQLLNAKAPQGQP